MEHVGIDLGAKHSHVVVMSSSAEVVLRSKVQTAMLSRWLEGRVRSRVVMEACTQSPAIANAARAVGHEAIVVPGSLVRALGVGARGIKTDGRDAEVLARAAVRNEHLPSVHLRSAISRDRRETLAARAMFVKLRRSIAVSVKSWLRGKLLSVRGKANTFAFSEKVRQVALENCDGVPAAIEALLGIFQHLCAQIEQLDETISKIVDEDETCARLMAIPGVGPQVSLSFTTHLDDPSRFANAEHVASFLALAPGEATTGGKIVRTGTLKAGPLYLKSLLIQAAWSLLRSRPDEPMVLWARSIADKRGKRIAIVALARKLATVMWSMWRHNTSYEPTRTSTSR